MKQILLAVAVIIFLFLNFGLKPYLKKQKAIKITEEILNLWTEGNLMDSAVYWEKKQDYPPLYGILSYKITSSDFYKKQNLLHSKISATLEFSANNLYADKKDWTFVLKRNLGYWKVITFYPSDNPPPEDNYYIR